MSTENGFLEVVLTKVDNVFNALNFFRRRVAKLAASVSYRELSSTAHVRMHHPTYNVRVRCIKQRFSAVNRMQHSQRQKRLWARLHGFAVFVVESV